MTCSMAGSVYASTGCGGPSTISLIAPPAGTIGYTFSNGETRTFNRYGPFSRTASSSAPASLLRIFDRAAFESVSARQLLDIRERRQLGLGQPVVIEQLLPLPDHAQVAVVHDDDLDG